MKVENTGGKVRIAGWGLAVVALTFALFVPAIRYEFVGFDDSPYVEANPMVRNGFSAEAVRWAWTTRHMGYWAPLLWTSYQADATVWGPEPRGFHLTNVILHALNAGLLFWLLRRWTRSAGWAFVLALLWALHPLRVESVAWIAERKGALSGFFFLLCLGFYTDGGEKKGWKYAAGAACLTFAMLAKPGTLITTPFVLLLLDVWPLRRFDGTWSGTLRLVREKWAFWISAFGFGYVAWFAARTLQYVRVDMPPLGMRLLLIPGNYLAYFRQLVWPADLSILYPTPTFHLGLFFVAVAGGSAGLSFAWRHRRRHPEFLVGLLWILGMLVPSIGLEWTGSTEGLGDRFTYLPAMGACVLGAGLWSCCARTRARWAVVALAVGATAAFAWMARLHLSHWRTADALLERAVAVAPENVVARIGQGYVLSTRKQWAAALKEYEWVLGTRHHMRFQAIVPSAHCWLQLGHPERAIQILEDMELFDPNVAFSRHTYLGQALLDAGRAAEAAPHLQAVLQRYPALTELWPDSFLACFEAGRGPEGLRLARDLTRFDGKGLAGMEDLLPFYVQKWNGGEKHRALAYFKKVIARNAENPLVLNNFAWLLAVDADQTADPQLALDCAEKAMALGGAANPSVWDTLAVARANAGDFPGARAAADHAVELARAAGDAELAARIEARRAGYRQGRPWRETTGRAGAPAENFPNSNG